MTTGEWGLTATAVGVTAVAIGWVLKYANKRGARNLEPGVSREAGKPIMGRDGRIAGVIFKKKGVKR
jgi:hypothetical protein